MSKIKWFHLELKELIDSKNITVKRLCQELDLNYMKMLKVLKGDCLLQQSCLDPIIKSKLFSREEIQSLERSFKHVNIKVEERNKIAAIESILNSLYETITEKATSEKGFLETKEDRLHMKMAVQINDHIYKSYTCALKEAFIKGESDFKIILFLPEMPAMIHEVYHTIKALMSCLDKRINWSIQCMLVQKHGPDNCKEAQMIHLSKYIKLSTLSPNIRVHILDNCQKSKVKYGVYFQDRTLFFNTRDRDLILEYRDHQKVFSSVNYKVNNLFKTYYDGPSFNAYLSNLMNTDGYMNNHHYGIRSYLSAVSIGQTFSKAHIQNFENNSVDLLEIYQKKETEILSNEKVKKVQFICERGIEVLLREGYVPDYTPIGEPLDEVSRLALIYDALVKASKGYCLRLLPIDVRQEYPFMRVIQFFEMHQKSNQWILARSKPPKEYLDRNKPSYKDDMYAIVIEDANLVESFELFCKHAIWHKTLSTKQSIDRIKALVLKFFENNMDAKIQYLKNKIEAFEFNVER